MPTDGWYPPAIDNWAPSNAGDHLGPVTVGCLHKTISPHGSFKPRPDNYFGHQSYPHFTTDVQDGVFKCWQHISIRKAAKALRNRSGGVQTNREGVIQIEIVGYASDQPWLHPDPKLNDIHYAGLAELMRWIESETEIPRSCGVEFHQYPPENGIKLDGNEPWRLSGDAWVKYAGWLGHQHVPENVHGDPGLININRLLGVAAPTPTPSPAAPITSTGSPSMVIVLDGANHKQWLCDLQYKRHLNGAESKILQAAGVPLIKDGHATGQEREIMLGRLVEVENIPGT